MSLEPRPTESVLRLVKATRLRIVVPVQAVAVLGAAALVWGTLADSHPDLAFAIIGLLVASELGLLLLFLRDKPPTDEDQVRPMLDNATETHLDDQVGGTLVVDKVGGVIRAKADSLKVPTRSVQTVLVDQGTDARIMLATGDDLIVLCEIPDATDADRGRLLATGRLLARAAALPFGDES
ncbi:MAG: hypothetical protein HY903_17090 [Deltaproteobacteria bacterium]|nr:hypothetical protein [Deltaproteobacteria bacterium]